MHQQPTEFAATPSAVDSSSVNVRFSAGGSTTRTHRRRRVDWRLGGRAVRKWDHWVLLCAFAVLAFGMAAALLVGRSTLSSAPEASLLTLWAGMGVAICAAIARARPAGLLRFKAIDILWGLGVGLLLRFGAGAISGANISPFPTTGSVDGSVSIQWSWTQVVPAALVAPAVEELFFRAVVLVAMYQLLRRSVGSSPAGLTAALFSAGTFVLLHAAFAAVDFVSGLELFTLGMVCSAAVLLTGRIWGAVLIHAVYNATFLALSYVGTAAL